MLHEKKLVITGECVLLVGFFLLVYLIYLFSVL